MVLLIACAVCYGLSLLWKELRRWEKVEALTYESRTFAFDPPLLVRFSESRMSDGSVWWFARTRTPLPFCGTSRSKSGALANLAYEVAVTWDNPQALTAEAWERFAKRVRYVIDPKRPLFNAVKENTAEMARRIGEHIKPILQKMADETVKEAFRE